MILILYVAKTILVSGLLYSYYWLFLRNKQFHQYNRFYLLSIPLIASGLPLIKIPVPGYNTNEGIKLLKVITVSDWENAVTITTRRNGFHAVLTLQHAIWGGYIIVALLFLYAFLRSVLYVLRISRKYAYEKLDDIRFFMTPEPGTPFSFMKNIFWSHAIETQSKEGEQVLRHELYHVRQHHTADILYMELVSICCWFNPFFHLVRKEVKVIHEFLADQYAISGNNRYDYAELLLWQSLNARQIKLTNPFFHNQVKRRISMITTFRNTRYGYISRLMALPLMFILFCAFAIKLTGKKTGHAFYATKTITVVVDAGHGGIDPGTNSGTGILEKNINLSIAKKIQQLSKEYNVNVIMTRDNDILPGNAGTIREGLINRVSIAESNKADFIISIHTDGNLSNPAANGFEIYLSDENPYYQKSARLGSALTEEIKKTYAILPVLKRAQTHVKVLRSPLMPSVIVECGYITNKNDLAFITKEENQEKIATDILKGIIKYANSTDNAALRNDKNIDMEETKDTVKPTDYRKTFTKVEIESEYPGGSSAWSDYLRKNLAYPEKAVTKNVQGTVIVRFIVNTDSTLSDVKILKSPDKILSEETVRIIKNSGKWIPAIQKGRQVTAYKIQPLVFRLVAG